MSARRRPHTGFLVIFTVLGLLGLASLGYILVNQGASLPFRDTYRVQAEFEAADGVIRGLGQPVNVAGVKVGQVVDNELADGRSLLTLEINRGLVPEIHRDATATLEPITPLKDMQVNLDPGRPRSGALPEDGRIPLARTNVPVELSEILAALDADTRSFLTTLLESMGEGTRGRAADIRRMLRALGPTSEQVERVNRALDRRRDALRRLVTNMGTIARAASRDGRLAVAVAAANRTLGAVAKQDEPLREAIGKLPGTLDIARSTLANLRPFADRADPALAALLPAVRRLPGTLDALRPLADEGADALKTQVRPLLREARPLARDLGPLVPRLADITPRLARSFQVLTYAANELAYNPPGDDEGFLFWLAWFMGTWNSVVSFSDAHGGIGRASPLFNCEGLETVPELRPIFDQLDLCPSGPR